jgi:SAM-dependent methyltransferase
MSNAKSDYNEFYDPRLVSIYNTVCALGDEKEFYIKLAKNFSAKTIIDLGCGTGLLTIDLAKFGYQMVGVEPSNLMLEVAIKNSENLKIHWIHGDAMSLKEFNADLAIMTGHVAQFHLDEGQWSNALKSIYKALKPGGYLAFESRNPDVQPWNNENQSNNTDWYAPNFHKKFYDPKEGEIEYRAKLIEVNGELVTSEGSYHFTKNGQELASINTLIFRTREEIEESLKNADFSVETVYGNWDGSIASKGSPEFIFVAKRN